MDVTRLRYFVHVATAHSFAVGARLAHVSPPAMSKAIRLLEDEVGAALFERTTRRVTLTAAGEQLLERGRGILAQIDALPEAIAHAGTEVAGELRIAAMEVFSSHVLPTAVAALIRAHAGVTPLIYEMTPDQMERHIALGSLDVGLTIGGGGARGVAYETLGTSPGVIVCGRRHPLYREGRITRADLARHPFVAPSFFQREHLPTLDQFPDAIYPRRVGATIELMQTGLELAVAGAYLGYFPHVSAIHHLRSGRLRALHGLRPGPPFQLRMLLRSGVPPSACVAALTQEIERTLRAAMATA
jgi:DNA-binding transcriptional LysR family regulator